MLPDRHKFPHSQQGALSMTASSPDTNDNEDGPNTLHHQGHPIPRDPSAYQPSDHYLNRLKYRRDPSIEGWIVRDLIETGRLMDDRWDDNRYAFEKRVWSEGWHDWRLLVSVDTDDTGGVEWRVVTAYCGCHDDDREDCQ